MALAMILTAAGLVYVLWPRQSVLESMSYDSYRYLAGAESIRTSGRYTDLSGEPQRIWPPGLSLLYAGLSRVSGIAPERLVPLVNALSFIATAVFLVLLARATEMRWWTAGLMLAAVLLNSAVLAAHRKLWSEPPVLALLVAMLWCVAVKRHRALVAAVLIASVAIVFRFAMLATVPFLAIAIALQAKRKVLALLPLLAPLPWFVLVRLLGAPASSGRASSFHFASWNENLPAIVTLGAQFFPVLGVAVILVAIVVAVIAGTRLAKLAALWIVCYGAFLIVAQAVATPSFTLDLRILLPMYAGMVVCVAAGIEGAASRRWLALLLAVPLLLVAPRGARQFVSPSEPRPNCIGRDEFVAALQTARLRGPITTNAAGLVWYATRQRIVDRGGTLVWLDPNGACDNVLEIRDAPPRDAIVIGRSDILSPVR